MIIHVDLRWRSPALRRPHGHLITRLLSLSRRELRSTGPDRHNGEGGRARGGDPGAVRGGGVSESVAKAPRAGIGGEKKRGISTFFLRRSGAIGAFATDLDKRRRHGPREGRRGRLFSGRLVVFPGGGIMKAVRGVVLSALPGCDTRGCQGRWGAGPVVMARPGRLRACRGESGATGSAGRSSGADRVERGRFRRPPLRPAAGRLVWWDGVSHVVTRPARLDHLRSVGPPYFVNQVVQPHLSGPTEHKWSKQGSTAMTPLNNL